MFALFAMQLMVRGETGRTGNPVRQHVVLELSNECACAQIHVLYLEEETVLVAVASQGPAEECLVQVNFPNPMVLESNCYANKVVDNLDLYQPNLR